MKLIAIEKKIAHGVVRLTGYVQLGGGGELKPFFEFAERFAPLVAENADPFVAALLLPAMACGEDLEIEPSVSRRLWNNLPRIQEIFHSWYPDVLKSISLKAGSFHEATPGMKDYTGSFFSLGVDSFHTLLRHEKEFAGRERITHLIYMAGFEVPLAEFTDGRERAVIEGVEEAAHIWGKEAICGRTNLRDCFPLDWPRNYHGAVLAATALALSGGMRRVLFASSYSWRYLKAWGSHPLTDPLWSSDNLQILHDGTADDRTQKITETILNSPEAIRLLRVCTNKRGGAGNCGFCGKCLRTMVTLEIAGALKSSGAFPSRLPRDFWRRLKLVSQGDLNFADENLRYAREKQAPNWIINGLERALAMGRLELVRKERGDLGFTVDLFRLAFEKTIGRLILYPERRRRRHIRPPKHVG